MMGEGPLSDGSGGLQALRELGRGGRFPAGWKRGVVLRFCGVRIWSGCRANWA